jgi:uncharacterized protein (DUF952 family)
VPDRWTTGEYQPAAFGAEGFVHCSYAQQVCGVANRLFRGRSDLVLLEIDPSLLPSPIVDENLEGGAELFPHVYCAIPAAAVRLVHPFPCRVDGCFDLPAQIPYNSSPSPP